MVGGPKTALDPSADALADSWDLPAKHPWGMPCYLPGDPLCPEKACVCPHMHETDSMDPCQLLAGEA